MSLQCKHPEQGAWAPQKPPTGTCQGDKSLSHLNWLSQALLPAVANISLPISWECGCREQDAVPALHPVGKTELSLAKQNSFFKEAGKELLLSSARLRALTGEMVCVEGKEGQSWK